MSTIKRLDDEVADLIPAAQRGGTAARDELLRRCHRTIYRWALVLTGDRDEAEDVAQEALVRVYRHLSGFSGRARFTTWLYRLTRNTALGLRRQVMSRLRLARRFGEHVVATPPVPEEDPVARVQRTDLLERVTTLFLELPVRQREVFHLADMEGFTAAEIGEQLGMKPVTVRAHLLRARRALRARLLEERQT